jgi:hypothetical protein
VALQAVMPTLMTGRDFQFSTPNCHAFSAAVMVGVNSSSLEHFLDLAQVPL